MFAATPPPRPHNALPQLLQCALDAMPQPIAVRSGPIHNLPDPGLHISALSAETITLPLHPAKAKLLATVADSHPDSPVDNDNHVCFEFEHSRLTFTSPHWQPALLDVVRTASRKLGVDTDCVRAELHKMVLYRRGGHLNPFVHYTKSPATFATLVVQLPSYFTGGELIIKNGDSTTVHAAGAHDTSCQHTPFYLACYADAVPDLRCLKSGWRPVLVYHLIWCGSGATPTTTGGGIDNVEEALRCHVDETINAVGAWKLPFTLQHQYKKSSLSKSGLCALKGTDKRYVMAIQSAAKAAELGDLSIVVCELSREYYSDDEEDGGLRPLSKSETRVVKIHAEVGSICDDTVSFVDWEQVALRNSFEVVRRAACFGSETSTCNAIVFWPREKTFELIFLSTGYIGNFMKNSSLCIASEHVCRVIACLELRGDVPDAWCDLQKVFSCCIEHKLEGQVSWAIKFASELQLTPGIERSMLSIMQSFEWDSIRDALENYLVPQSVKGLSSIRDRLMTLSFLQIQGGLPTITVWAALKKIIEFLEVNQTMSTTIENDLSPSAKPPVQVKQDLWPRLLDIILSSPPHPDGIFRAEEELHRIEELVPRLREKDMDALNQALSLFSNDQRADALYNKVDQRISAIYSTRFMKQALHIIVQKSAPTPDGALTCFRVNPEWSSFLELVNTVFSKEVDERVARMFRAFLNVIPGLPREDIRELVREFKVSSSNLVPMSALSQVWTAAVEADRVAEKAIRETELARERAALEAQQIVKVAQLRSDICELERATTSPPSIPTVCYPCLNTGDARIDSFMASTEMSAVIPFDSVVTADKVLRKAERKFPGGMCSFSGGRGRKSYIELRKPKLMEHEAAMQCEKNSERLEAMRGELATLEHEIRGLEEEYEKHVAKKARKNERGDSVDRSDGPQENHSDDIFLQDV